MADKLIRCSFCGKTQGQVERILSGPNAYICNECVDLCSSLLHENMYETAGSEQSLEAPERLPTPKEPELKTATSFRLRWTTKERPLSITYS